MISSIIYIIFEEFYHLWNSDSRMIHSNSVAEIFHLSLNSYFTSLNIFKFISFPCVNSKFLRYLRAHWIFPEEIKAVESVILHVKRGMSSESSPFHGIVRQFAVLGILRLVPATQTKQNLQFSSAFDVCYFINEILPSDAPWALYGQTFRVQLGKTKNYMCAQIYVNVFR